MASESTTVASTDAMILGAAYMRKVSPLNVLGERRLIALNRSDKEPGDL
jgi:hypothetical protein